MKFRHFVIGYSLCFHLKPLVRFCSIKKFWLLCEMELKQCQPKNVRGLLYFNWHSNNLFRYTLENMTVFTLLGQITVQILNCKGQ